MKILLAGPILTSAVQDVTGINLSGLPPATAQTPISPLAAGLLAAGHEVELLTTDPSVGAPETHRRGSLTITYCPVRGEPRYRARVRSSDLFAVEIAYLTAAMRASEADIVHAHWTYEFAEAAIRSGKPMVATMHDLGWECLSIFRDLYRAMRLVMKYRAMLRVPHLTAVAPFVAAKAWQYGHFGRVEVVPNPIAMAPAPEKLLDKPVIATIGNDGRIKNVTASIAAFRLIRERFPDAELHLFGPGLEADGALAGGGAGVVYHGNTRHRDLMDFLEQRATLLVHPSRIEACPVIIGEAKMRGVPVIAGERSGGTPYVVGEAGGVLVDIEQPDAIAEAALVVLSDSSRYRAMQAAGHDDAAARFSIEAVTRDYVAVYERILASDHASPAKR